VDAKEIFEELAATGTAFAAPVHGSGIGLRADRPVSPASVGKTQIALASRMRLLLVRSTASSGLSRRGPGLRGRPVSRYCATTSAYR
jgi:hypothetical protein